MTTLHVDADGIASELNALVPSVSIENLLRQRSAVLERYGQALALITEARDIARAATLGGARLLHECRGERHSLLEADALARLANDLDSVAWGYLIHESGLRTFLDAKARREWDTNLYEGKVPELTKETIAATFRSLFENRRALFERGVIQVFKSLSWHYKTNSPVRFGKRIILNRLFSVYNKDPAHYFASLNHDEANELDDLIRVFSILDGVPAPDHRQGAAGAIRAALDRQVDAIELPYLALKWYRKGSGHVTFKRLDLVDGLNEIIGRHFPEALPAPH